jgi:hypothetical protein
VSYMVDCEALAALGAALAHLRSEFDRAEDTMADLHAAVGHDELASRLESFATNWSDKRARVADSLQALADFARSAAAVYCETDQQLATAMPVVETRAGEAGR